MAKKTYRPKDHARFNKEQAAILGRVMEELGDLVTPRQLVDYARPKSSPIHSLFEWDDTAAAERYRISQAQHHIQHLEIEIFHEGKPAAARAYHSIVVETDEECRGEAGNNRSYASAVSVAMNPDWKKQVIAQALAEAQSWQARYQTIRTELADIFNAIDSARARRRNARKAVAAR